MDNRESEISKVKTLDPDISDQELAEWLEWAAQTDLEANPSGCEAPLPDSETEVLRGYAIHRSPAVRAVAIGFLCEHGPADWTDVEAWLSDPDKNVRKSVVGQLYDTSPVGRLYCSDQGRFINLLAASVGRYGGFELIWELQNLGRGNVQAFELVWKAAETVLDCDNFEAISEIVVGYFEDVIPDRNWGPDDSHIRPWIEGDEWNRKAALLNIGRYLHLKYGRTREIIEALSRDTNPEIAERARHILAENPPETSPQRTKHKWKRHRKTDL